MSEQYEAMISHLVEFYVYASSELRRHFPFYGRLDDRDRYEFLIHVFRAVETKNANELESIVERTWAKVWINSKPVAIEGAADG
jgi:hypothetical protein